MLFMIGVLKNFGNLIGKHLCWSLFFKKVAGLETFKNAFFKEHLQWLLLSIRALTEEAANENY